MSALFNNNRRILAGILRVGNEKRAYRHQIPYSRPYASYQTTVARIFFHDNTKSLAQCLGFYPMTLGLLLRGLGYSRLVLVQFPLQLHQLPKLLDARLGR